METVSADNEGELTSTMGNVMSVPSKEEKNDTNDATPTSSTDANTFSAASHVGKNLHTFLNENITFDLNCVFIVQESSILLINILGSAYM